MCSARRSFRLGYKKHMTPPLVDSASSRWVILGRSGFSFTKPLQFLAHATFLGLHRVCLRVHLCPTAALPREKSLGPVRALERMYAYTYAVKTCLQTAGVTN